MIFEELKERHVIDPKSLPAQNDLAVFNPLSTASDSPWAMYFRNKELEKSIMQDIARTHPGSDFFQQQWVRDGMLQCLFLFAKENGATCYRQGMHELLAVVMQVLNVEKLTADQLRAAGLEGEALACHLLTREHIVADSFTVFKHLMHMMNPLFEVVDIRQKVSSDGGYIADKKQAEEHAIAQAPIVNRCRRIQYTLLKKFDLPLHNSLKTMGIEPQLYALRWIRLLFGREFHHADVVTLWDAIFAWGSDLALVDYIAVTMLMYIRESILAREYTDAMSRLMKFPPVENVQVFVESALQMAQGGKPAAGKGVPLASKAHSVEESSVLVFNASTGSAGMRVSTTSSPSPTNVAPSKPASSNARGHRTTPPASAAGVASDSSSTLEKRLAEVEESNAILARRLASVIEGIQTQILHEASVLPDMDEMFLALAELKQMKDILSGALDTSDTHLLFGGGAQREAVRSPLHVELADDGEVEATAVGAVDTAGEREGEDATSVPSPVPMANGMSGALSKPVAIKAAPVAVQWGDEDEELGEKKKSEGTPDWMMGMFK